MSVLDRPALGKIKRETYFILIFLSEISISVFPTTVQKSSADNRRCFFFSGIKHTTRKYTKKKISAHARSRFGFKMIFPSYARHRQYNYRSRPMCSYRNHGQRTVTTINVVVVTAVQCRAVMITLPRNTVGLTNRMRLHAIVRKRRRDVVFLKFKIFYARSISIGFSLAYTRSLFNYLFASIFFSFYFSSKLFYTLPIQLGVY